MQRPKIGSHWVRRDDEDRTFEVMDVYEAKRRTLDGFEPVTLVKIVEIELMPWHCPIESFHTYYRPEEEAG